MKRILPRLATCAEIAAMFLLSACGDKPCPPNAPCPTPTPGGPSSCAVIAGTRNSFWSDSCGRSGSDMMVITQVGCTFNGTMSSLGSFSGTITGNTLTYTLTFSTPCTGTATGTASVSGPAISGSYSGTQSGSSNCCTPVTGTFSIQFPPTPSTTLTPTPVP